MNFEDGFKGELTVDEFVEMAKRFEAEGASTLVPSGGFTARTSLYIMRGHVPFIEFVRSETNPLARLGTFVRQVPRQALSVRGDVLSREGEEGTRGGAETSRLHRRHPLNRQNESSYGRGI